MPRERNAEMLTGTSARPLHSLPRTEGLQVLCSNHHWTDSSDHCHFDICAHMDAVMIPIQITPGEAVDRLSILKIKQRRGHPTWQDKLSADVETLQAAVYEVMGDQAQADITAMMTANERLWDLEDRMHAVYLSDSVAASVGRSIAVANGERSAIKKDIDNRMGVCPEFKSYGN